MRARPDKDRRVLVLVERSIALGRLAEAIRIAQSIVSLALLGRPGRGRSRLRFARCPPLRLLASPIDSLWAGAPASLIRLVLGPLALLFVQGRTRKVRFSE